MVDGEGGLPVVPIALGVLAFRRGRWRAVRVGCAPEALAVYAFVISIAHERDPPGIFGALASRL